MTTAHRSHIIKNDSWEEPRPEWIESIFVWIPTMLLPLLQDMHVEKGPKRSVRASKKFVSTAP
jgi:hypothetical protein